MSKSLFVFTLAIGLTVGQAFAEDPKPAPDSKQTKPTAEVKAAKPVAATPAPKAVIQQKPGTPAAPAPVLKATNTPGGKPAGNAPAAKLAAGKGEAKAKFVPTGNLFLNDKNGEHFVDPVCGMLKVASASTPSESFEGRKYLFCSSACAGKFKADPAKYKKDLILPGRVISADGDKITALDPVTRSQVKVDGKTPNFVDGGRRYYFASDSSKKAFSASPIQFLMPKSNKGTAGSSIKIAPAKPGTPATTAPAKKVKAKPAPK